jgi:hypothetical protein
MSTLEKDFQKAMVAAEAVEKAKRGQVDVEARGTCQACLGGYVAKPYSRMKEKSHFTGEPMNYPKGALVMVKHGFTRPGHGYLVGECWGVGHPPFQLDCTITKHWLRYLVTDLLPDKKRKLSDLKSGKIKRFSFEVSLPLRPGEPSWAKRTTRTIFLTEGAPIPAEWTNSYEPDFKRARMMSIMNTEGDIREISADIVHLGKAIASWKYSPEQLGPKEKPLTESQTMRRWVETADWREFEKLPSPRGDSKTFAEWARRVLRPSGMSDRVPPSHYVSIREAYEKATGAAPLRVDRPARESEVVSREVAEQRSAREAKLAARQAALVEKTERANKRNSKALVDIAELQAKVGKMIDDREFLAWMKSKPWPNIWTGSPTMDYTIYDHLVGDQERRQGFPVGLRARVLRDPIVAKEGRPVSAYELSSRRSDLKNALQVLKDWRNKWVHGY